MELLSERRDQDDFIMMVTFLREMPVILLWYDGQSRSMIARERLIHIKQTDESVCYSRDHLSQGQQ